MPDHIDQKFLDEKDSLVKGLEDLAEYLGDEDAKSVKLPSYSGRQVDTFSANSEPGHLADLEEA